MRMPCIKDRKPGSSLIVFNSSLIVFDSHISIPLLEALSFVGIASAIEVRHYMLLGLAIMTIGTRFDQFLDRNKEPQLLLVWLSSTFALAVRFLS